MAPGWSKSEKTEPKNSNDVELSESLDSDENESPKSHVTEEPMEVDTPKVKTVNMRKKEIDEEELEEGEIIDDEEEEEGEIDTSQEETPQPLEDYRRKSDDRSGRNDSKQSGSVRQLSLADLGLPTSFATK